MAPTCSWLLVWHLRLLGAWLSCRIVLGQIGLGSTLSAGANEAWVSQNRTFAFGFTTSSGQKDRYQLAIWFAQLPGDRTLVWSPTGISPVGKDATLELDNTGNLVLADGAVTVWTSNSSGIGISSASLLDTGNLVLYNSTRFPAWESFSHPSDTLLPEQPLSVSMELMSSVSPIRGGYYTLKMLQQTTSLSLALTYNLPYGGVVGTEPYANYSYWASPDISNTTGDVTAVLGQDGSLGIVYGESSNGAVYVYKNTDNNSVSRQTGTVLRRLTLETNGNVRLYRWDDDVNGSSQWVADWAAVSNPCDIAGICGNGICTLNKSKTNATCRCLPGTKKDESSGLCLEDSSSIGSCESSPGSKNQTSDKLKISTVQQTSYYFTQDSVIANYSDDETVSKCGDVCLSDCDCIASVYGLDEEQPYCWVLKGLDFGGFEDPGSNLFVKTRSNGSGSSVLSTTRGKAVVIPVIIIMVILIGLLCTLLYYNVHRKRSLRRAMESSLMLLPGAPMSFSYRDLQIRTSHFAVLLGTGGFGSVYKGTLVDGTLVAVKKLDRVHPHGEKEFITEVNTIGSMHHMNLVRLCGYCSEGSQRLLVYEFMKNGSLDKWIFPSSHKSCDDRLLDWETRFRIALGTAQGIAYFHEQCRDRIIHCDIKPENILLDENFCPKVSDFGLAKLMKREHSHVMTMVRGTRGYLAPEWISNRPITVKADVYSYGMLLLEIIGGRRNLDMSYDVEDFFFPGWAYKEMVKGSAIKVADRRMEGSVDEEELIRALKVAFWCIQDEVFMRPTMGEVVKMLEGSMDINRPPMPQTVLELIEEGLDQVYRAMKREFNHVSSFTITSHLTSNATCSYSTMSPR